MMFNWSINKTIYYLLKLYIMFLLNPFHANNFFWYPLETSENRCFQGVSTKISGMKWVKKNVEQVSFIKALRKHWDSFCNTSWELFFISTSKWQHPCSHRSKWSNYRNIAIWALPLYYKVICIINTKLVKTHFTSNQNRNLFESFRVCLRQKINCFVFTKTQIIQN